MTFKSTAEKLILNLGLSILLCINAQHVLGSYLMHDSTTTRKATIKSKVRTGQLSYLLCGTYTNGKSKGIQEYLFNSKTGQATFVRTVPMSNPSYLCISKNEKFVYAVSEDENKEGAVKAFTFDSHTGKLNLLGTRLSGGNSPCYVSVNDKNTFLFVANYGSGTVSAFKLLPSGTFDTAKEQVISNKGRGPNKKRQESAHAHSVVISPDQDFLFTADLGTDKEMVYSIQDDKKTILLEGKPPYIQLPAGSGPRHLIFHPNKKFAYLIQELNAHITVFNYTTGKLDSIQTVSLEPDSFKGTLGAADIHISQDGRFVYASNRGDANDITIFSISANGRLKFLSRDTSGGKTPRNFSIDLTGKYLLVANQNTDNVVIYKRNPSTGMLVKSATEIAVGSPVCLKFARKN